MNDTILSIKNLNKQFRSHWTYKVKSIGIKDISFDIQKGESFALLGANGAGKTTTIKCILGLIRPTSGIISINKNLNFDKSKIGFLPEQPYFYQHLSICETLHFYAGLFGYSSEKRNLCVEKVLKKLNIFDLKDRKVKTLSKGQQQRVGIAQSLINDPDFIILDEPFSGLDPVSRVEIKNLFRELKESGKTLMISSHVLSDIEELCDRAIILKAGNIKKEVQIKDLKNVNSEDSVFKVLVSGKSLKEIDKYLESLSIVPLSIKNLPGDVVGLEFSGQKKSENALHMLIHFQINILEFSKKLQSLEDIFVEVSQGAM
jgi:ABC-2 type transport system ATP-binding protein